jgi:hypothetical protein
MYNIDIISGELEQEIISSRHSSLSFSLLIISGVPASAPSFGGDLVLNLNYLYGQ